MMCYISQYHAVQHIWELLQVKISCKLYYTEFDIPLNQNSGWRLSCQLVCLQHRQLWQHNLQGGRNTHKADFCLWTLSGDSCQSWKNAYKPVRSICIFFYAKLLSWVRVGKLCSKGEGRETVFRWANFSSGGSRTAWTLELLWGYNARSPKGRCSSSSYRAGCCRLKKQVTGLWDFWENNILGFCNYLNWVLWIIQH